MRAPYTGIVEQRLVEIGESVSPGKLLYSGMSLDKVRVVANVPQTNIDAVRQNRQALVYISPDNPIQLAGEALTFFAYADPDTSSFKVRVNLPEGTPSLYPGMYLKTAFKIGERQALTTRQTRYYSRGGISWNSRWNFDNSAVEEGDMGLHLKYYRGQTNNRSLVLGFKCGLVKKPGQPQTVDAGRPEWPERIQESLYDR